ncbi:MAG: T9SS type A sorting domain-containing protein, partial [Paludibacter sp.]
ITVNGIHSNVIIGAGTTFNASTFTHNVAGDWTNSGTFTSGTSTINFNGTAAQTITGVNSFNNVTINSVGVTATANQSVNGILDMQSSNASEVKGSLDMGVNTLSMGADATTTGTGDVSGIVTRTSIIAGTVYTFGNQYSTITFPAFGTIPTALSLNISLGAAPSWKTNAINRKYILSQTGGSGTKAYASLHYLDSELNGNTENQMVVWLNNGAYVIEVGRSSYDVTNNFYELSDINLTDPTYNFSLGNSVTGFSTWNGSLSSAWAEANNWTPIGVPTYLKDVTIPDASITPNDPEISSTLEVNTISIENGAVFNAATSSQLTILGSAGAWNNQGTFNPGTSTIIFKGADATMAGTTDFNNVTIYSGAALRNEQNSVMRIGGILTNSGTWRAATFENTVEYSGTSQSIVNPNGTTPGYHNLAFSGSGTKTAAASLALLGNLTIGAGTTFAPSTGSHAIAGNIVCDGTITPSTSTVTLNGSTAQTIGGVAYPSFYNLTIDNASGVTMLDSAAVAGTLLINSAKKLVIATKAKMVAQIITNNAGTSGLVLKSNATDANGTLIFNNEALSPVSATVEMYSKAIAQTYTSSTNKYSNYRWQFCGIPVATVGVLGPINGGYIRQWGETTGTWTQLQNANTLTAFTGYEITQPFAKTYYFSGSLVNNDKTVTLTKGTGNGMNLIGNPYTAAINIKSLSFASSGVDKTVYLYNTGSTADWATQTGTDWSPGQYILATQALAGTGGIPAQIPSMTAFFVKATTTGSTLTIPYSAVTKNIDKQRTKAISPDKVYTIIDVKGSTSADRMWLFTDGNCTHDFDNGWDGQKLMGSALNPQIYAQELAGNYQIDAVDNVNNTNLAFQAGIDSYYTLTFTHENIEATYPALYLIDLGNNNKVTDITLSGTQYSFTASSTPTAVNRFKIVTSLGSATQNQNIGSGSLKIYSFESTIFIDNKNGVDGEIKLYDLSGQELKQIRFAANCISNHKVDLSPGSYIIKAEAATERVSVNLIIR